MCVFLCSAHPLSCSAETEMWNESEGKVYPRRGHEGPEGAYRHSITPSLNSALDGGG